MEAPRGQTEFSLVCYTLSLVPRMYMVTRPGNTHAECKRIKEKRPETKKEKKKKKGNQEETRRKGTSQAVSVYTNPNRNFPCQLLSQTTCASCRWTHPPWDLCPQTTGAP